MVRDFHQKPSTKKIKDTEVSVLDGKVRRRRRLNGWVTHVNPTAFEKLKTRAKMTMGRKLKVRTRYDEHVTQNAVEAIGPTGGGGTDWGQRLDKRKGMQESKRDKRTHETLNLSKETKKSASHPNGKT